MSEYVDNTWPELGVRYQWNNTTILESIRTKRNTLIEMVERPNWGIACYMDGAIQSCTLDESIYHEALVHPAMGSVYDPKRVMIIGGGEGATLREVLKWPSIEQVDMYEWDEEVVQLFQTKYPQWAKEAWKDPRVTIHYDDIFDAITIPPPKSYNVIIIDLFDPCEENSESWTTLFRYLPHWISVGGSIAIYAGMRCRAQSIQPYQFLMKWIEKSPIHKKEPMFHPFHIHHRDVIPYRVYIPSFLGESMFLLLKSRAEHIMFSKSSQFSNLNKEIWKSYRTLNW